MEQRERQRVRICVLGAGATGGHFAVKLAAMGHQVSVVARGAHLAAIQRDGLTLHEADKTLTVPVLASADAAELGVQDFVIVGVKATGLAGIIAQLRPLVGPTTLVVFPQNGMSWWYPVQLPARLPAPPELPIFSIGQEMMQFLKAEQIIGGSIYSANELVAPGVIHNDSPGNNKLTLGAIGPTATAGLAEMVAALRESDISAVAADDIRQVIWSKLLMNMSGSAIALATENITSICRSDPGLAEIYRRVVAEGLAIAKAHGYPLDQQMNVETMLSRLVDHKPSLLQDYEQGRPMEVGEIILAPGAFARAAGIATPTLDVLAAIITRRARDRGLI
jgi:2-dehydropantoate 2-reductase